MTETRSSTAATTPADAGDTGGPQQLPELRQLLLTGVDVAAPAADDGDHLLTHERRRDARRAGTAHRRAGA